MPILAALGLVFQVLFAVHAVKTGRDRYWLYIIIFFPGIGCLVYFFAEYLPSMQQSRRLRCFKNEISHTLNPDKRLRLLREQVELTPSVKNKKLLAEECVNRGLFDEAIDLYQGCLDGAHQKDLHLLEGLACAFFFKADHARARDYLEQVVAHPESASANRDQFKLLLARSLEALGDDRRADDMYADVVRTFSGEEARCRYALYLKQRGFTQKAATLFTEILKNARLSPRYYKTTQKTWIEIARKESA